VSANKPLGVWIFADGITLPHLLLPSEPK